MAEPHTEDLIGEGWDVYDSEGERIGDVQEVTATWIRVEAETGNDLFVPLTSVEAAAGGEVYLDSPASESSTLGWDRPPEESRTEELLRDEGG
ncbi:MAG TPA: DUF2171 domain-containing protein [Candidatus Limnocylindrales bacterium]|nr:DUF2171 domain-containing protein [Candidatus Limnocylindrales bacterium]